MRFSRSTSRDREPRVMPVSTHKSRRSAVGRYLRPSVGWDERPIALPARGFTRPGRSLAYPQHSWCGQRSSGLGSGATRHESNLSVSPIRIGWDSVDPDRVYASPRPVLIPGRKREVSWALCGQLVEISGISIRISQIPNMECLVMQGPSRFA